MKRIEVMAAALAAAIISAMPFGVTASSADPVVGQVCPVEDVYLEGGEDVSINTGYYVGPKTRIVLDCSYEVPGYSSYTCYIFGFIRSGSDREREYPYFQSSDTYLAVCNNGNWIGTNARGSNQRQRIDYDLAAKKMSVYVGRSSQKVGDVNLQNNTDAIAAAPLSVYSIPKEDGTWMAGLAKLRVYSFKVYDDGRLVRDMIPYGYGAETGLVDRCSGKVYLNVRRGSAKPFAIGMDPASVRSVGDTFLDTGYYPNPATKLEIDFSIDDSVASSCILGCCGGSGAWWGLAEDGSKKLSRGFGEGSATYSSFNENITADGRRYKYTVDMPNKSETVEGGGKVLYSGTMSSVPATTSTLPLGLCCCTTLADNKTTPAQFSRVSIYSCRIWENGTLVREYVPRTVDDTTGLYDLRHDTFLTPTTAGKRLHQLEARGLIDTTTAGSDAYLVSHRTEGINTGYYIQPNSRLEIDYRYTKDALPWNGGTQMGVEGYLFIYAPNQNNNFLNACYAGGWNGAGVSGSQQGTGRRMKVVADMSKQVVNYYYRTSADPFLAFKMNNLTMASTLPMAVFCRSKMSEDQLTGNDFAYINLYSFKIYEGDVLKHAYYPLRKNGVLGLQDLETGAFLQNNLGSGEFELGGLGYEGMGAAFAKQPVGGKVQVDGSLVLTAAAPGADGYQWFADGVRIEGATTDSLTVDWHRGTPRQVVYRCVARYASWGYAESALATVEFARPGLFLVVK